MGDADTEGVESEVAIVSVPAGAIGRTALRSPALTSNLVMVQKSKITSNKLKECKSITGAIVQLINGMKKGSHNYMSTRVNMLLVHQMDAINRWMEKYAHHDHKEKHQQHKHERKHCEKHQAKKKA